MNEAIGIDADRDPFDHFPRREPWFQLLLDLGTERRAHAGEALSARFRRLGAVVLPSARGGSNPKRCARIAVAVPGFDEPLQIRIARGVFHLKRSNMIALLALLA